MKFSKRRAAAMAGALWLLAGCGATDTSEGSGATSPTPTGAPVGSPTAPDTIAEASAGTTASSPSSEPAPTSPGGTVPDTAQSTAEVPDTAQPTAAVPDTLKIQAQLVGGGSIDFAEFAGKPLAVWFWAPT